MEIRWIVGVATSCFYAAGQLLRGQNLLDAALAERLQEPVEQLKQAAAMWHVEPVALVDHLAAISSESISVEQQAQRAIRKLVGGDHTPQTLAVLTGWMTLVQELFLEVHPGALHELELRSAPLREQWEARGPGLIAGLKRQFGAEPLVENAEVVLIQPVTGGGGAAYATYNRVSFEAVLANPVAELPEVVRLGWLMSQLQLDLPGFQGTMSRTRALEVGALATVPVTLAAAYDVELAGPLEATLPRALEAWKLPSGDANTLLAWWETYLAERPPWGTALAALDQLLLGDKA